ncbi:hypothetical protein [Xenorhabdus cabanillasii]|uniref:Uncharacterized protein n=1 Tax=Xenorhabdus cabanillasii JM26 TaxID=1427517 RepID=W1JBS5_9GAMM|nr:hypothetical protein [Xenorhabdus cabanillasii]PHM79141.1 hypothetical protein Xcab_00223 [Xenorhabdus cabanillasii JM26]CDL87533.1 hypothetical protein XCR1_940019 [Xenorhabdus cabanillasii JM26]
MDFNKINFDSLKLDMDSPFFAIPNLPDHGVDGKKITVTASIIDIYGNPAPNISIFVSDSVIGNLKKVKIYGSDPNQEIPITHHNNREGFFIKTDGNGKVLFFIHPLQAHPVVLDLYSNLVGSTRWVSANHIIFIVNKSPDNMNVKFGMPQIINFFGDYLTSDGSGKFEVEIPGYFGAEPEDYILFFVNGKYTKHFFRRVQSGDSDTFYHLPYDIFTKDIDSNLFYVIIRNSGVILDYKSIPLPLIYKGGVKYKPEQNPESGRNYAACVVYDTGDNVIYDHMISYSTIRKYPENPEGGLFVEILGTTDPDNETDKVPLDILVTLNLYINSVNKSYIKSYSGEVKVQSLDTDNKVAAIIHVPFEDVADVKLYQNGEYANIYFDYTFYDSNKQYGKIWKADIETDI